MDINNKLITITVVVIVIYIYFNNKLEHLTPDTCDNQSPSQDTGITAKDACTKISSKADEIEAEMGGIAKITDSAWGLFTPNNYKSGDNKTDNMMRNIVNTNLSSCDITKIENDCKNSSTSVQLNSIDTTQCKYCETHLCNVKNVTQTNAAKISQTCTMQSAIETLLKKTNSIDSQALAQVLQKASGVLSGDNKSVSQNCNITNTDMSSQSYMDMRASCANSISVDQTNSLKACGEATNIVQKNTFDALQTCLQGSTVSKISDTTSDTKISAATKTDQASIGIDTTTLIIFVVVCCVISCSSIGILFYMSSNSGGNSGGDN